MKPTKSQRTRESDDAVVKGYSSRAQSRVERVDLEEYMENILHRCSLGFERRSCVAPRKVLYRNDRTGYIIHVPVSTSAFNLIVVI